MTRGFWIWCSLALCWIACALSGTPSAAHAQETKRVVVQSFRGPSGNVARSHVVFALKGQSEVELVPSDTFEGMSGAALRNAAAEADVSAILEGKVRKKGKQLEVTVAVRDVASGEVLHEQDWTRSKNQLKDIGDNFWSIMGPYIARTSAPSKKPEKKKAPEVAVAESAPSRPAPAAPRASREEEEAEEAGAAPAPEPEEPAAADGERRLHPALIAALGPRIMWRGLNYEGDTTLNGYSSYASNDGSPGFNLALQLQWFPGAHVRRDWLSDIGLDVEGDLTLGLKSAQGDKKYKTTAYDLGADLLFRLPFEIFEPRFRVGYLMSAFDVKGPLKLGVPGVKFQSVRIGVGTLIKLIDLLVIDASFAYLQVLDTGEFGTSKFASKLSAYGWEIGGGLMVRFKEVFGVRAAADFRRYAFNTHKSTNDLFVLPKKGTDDYLRATLSFVYMLPGAQ